MRPNVLVVLTDDHGHWATGCYGNSEVRTPTLDHLAATGVQMANAFTPSPVCSPARASFWTGRLPSQHGVHDYLADGDPQVAKTPWLQNERTLASLLHDVGYFTGLSGKWHLGPGTVKPEGFDFWYCRSAPVARPAPCYAPWPTVEETAPRYDRHAMTDRAVEFLRHRDADQSFFLTVGYFATHSPWSGHPERLVEAYRRCRFDDVPRDAVYPTGRLRSEAVYATRSDPREALAQYYAAVTDIDDQVGRLLDELENQGLRESTLVVYTSDHGLNAGHHGLWGKGNATIPYNMLEESIHVPLILNQPGTILGGQVRQEPVTHLDTFRTITEHAGVAVPTDRSYPGRSFRDLTLGKGIPDWTGTVHGEYGTTRMIRTSGHKLVHRHPDGPHELFDLAADPRETTNLHTDPNHQELVKQLTDDLNRYFDRYTDPRFSGLRVAELPRHNRDEEWRDPGEHRILDEPTWLANL